MNSCALILSLLPVVAVAEEGVSTTAPAEESSRLEVLPAGVYRVGGEGFSPLRLDAEGRNLGQRTFAAHRLSLQPEAHLGETAKVISDVQLASGVLTDDPPGERFRSFGPPLDFAAGEELGDQIHLRKLYLRWQTPIGVVMAGRMASQWGLGILASSGDDEQRDWGEPRAGADRNFGDIVDRVVFATAPLAATSDAAWAKDLIVALGADSVVRDERTLRSEGDRAYEAIGVVRYAHEKNVLGLYVALRDVVDRNSDKLRVVAYDVNAERVAKVGDLRMSAAFELSLVDGTTTLGRNNAFPLDDLLVQQLGWVARGGIMHEGYGVGGDVEAGYASGDSNPNDQYIRNFSFDPDYNPSLILFEHLRAAETVGAAANASDPARVGYPPSAARLLPTGGSVSNAIYLRPTVRYKKDGLGVRLAMLWARAEEDVVDPFNSTVAGGVARNFQGGDGHARDLGVEVDAGVDYELQITEPFSVTASVQGGRLFPGAAFANADGQKPDAINLVYGKVVARWKAD